MSDVIGIGLAAGAGVRCRPLTLKAQGYLRAKAAVRFLGRRVLDWQLHILNSQGIDDYLMLTRGKENRYQVKSIVGYGERYGVQMRYSPVTLDHVNTGSADAVLSNLDHFHVQAPAVFVFPTDSILDIDLPAMLDAHIRNGAIVTIAAAQMPAERIAHCYGLIDQDKDGRVRGFIEKPSLGEIYALHGGSSALAQLPPLMTNAGFYLMDPIVLREIGQLPEIQQMRSRRFDIGGDLLPWLVAQRFPVHTFTVGRMGDLGNIPSYLETTVDALHGRFTSITPLLYPDGTGPEKPQIDPTSLMMADPVSNLTLAQKIAHGLVTISAPVRVGKYVRIYPGVKLSECNIDDDCEILEHATITRSSVGEGSIIGAYSVLEDSLTGSMAEVQSSRQYPVTLQGYSAIGDEVVIRGNVNLHDGVTVHPRLHIPAGINIPPRMEIESSEKMLAYL